jgi:mannitol/fructose-specific phosphotransferase system IIA component (Ntr-type)
MSPETSLDAMIPSEAVVVPMRATEVDEALVELAKVLADAHGLSEEHVQLRLCERERLGSTAIGEGVALPHGRDDVEHTVGALGISPQGVRWGDGHVYVVIAVLSPLDGSEHVKALARLGRLFADRRLVTELRAASSPAQARALLVGTTPTD